MSNSIKYMLDRSLPLLLTDMTRRPASEKPLQSSYLIGLQTGHGSRSFEIPSYAPLFRVIHAIRTVELVLRQLLPACDRDLPFRLRRRRRLDSAGLSSTPDIPASLNIGAPSGPLVCYQAFEPVHDTVGASEVRRLLQDVVSYAAQAIAGIEIEYVRRNPLVNNLLLRLGLLRSSLRKALLRRPALNPQDSRTVGPLSLKQIRRRHSPYRSVRHARRIARHLAEPMTFVEAGNRISSKAVIQESRLYEFWCFCELTRELLSRQHFEVVQHSLLRVHGDSPVFSFGEGAYVFFEHRSNYFKVGENRKLQLARAHAGRGPEWIILRGGEIARSVIIDCKYYGEYRPSIIDSMHTYCADYTANLGIVFCASPPPKRPTSHSEISGHVFSHKPGNAQYKVVQVHLVPHPDREQFNTQIIEHVAKIILET